MTEYVARLSRGEHLLRNFARKRAFIAQIMGRERPVVELKLGFISQMLSGNLDRTIEDVTGDDVLSFAAIKAAATDQPLLQEKAEIDGQLSWEEVQRASEPRRGLSLDELPEEVAAVVLEVARYLGGLGHDPTVRWLFVADHRHEQLMEGAYSIAYEGGLPYWSTAFTGAVRDGEFSAVGCHLEALDCRALAVYPA